jgi:hypothetical protein
MLTSTLEDLAGLSHGPRTIISGMRFACVWEAGMGDDFDDWVDWDEVDELEAEAEDDAGGFHDGRLVDDGWDDGDGKQGVSAWDVGAGFALAGWLLDRQTDRIVDAVRGSAPTGAPPVPVAPAASVAPEAGGATVDWDASPLRPVGVPPSGGSRAGFR